MGAPLLYMVFWTESEFGVKFGSGFEFHSFACGNNDFFFGAGVEACAFALFRNRESTKTNERYFVVGCKGFGYSIKGGIKGVLGVDFGEICLFGNCVDEFCFVHNNINYGCFFVLTANYINSERKYSVNI